MNILHLILRRRWFNKDGFTTLTVILLAYMGTLAALTGYINERADNTEALYNGQVIEQTMQVATTLAVGQFTADYGWTQAFRLWLEMDTLGYLASAAEDDVLTARYDAVRDRLTGLSPVLRAPYFDPAMDNVPDIRRYESDIYVVDLTRQQQQLALTQAIANHWGAIDSDTGLLKRIITTSLLLMALVTTVFDNLRLKQVALVIVLLSAIYSTAHLFSIEQRTVPARPAEAMDKLAEGAGLAYQYRYDEAAAAFGAALALDPTYTEAHVQRGFAYRDSYDITTNPDHLAAATADFEAAIAAGRREVDVIGQLAELYYLQGRFTEAMRVSQVGVETTDEFIHTFDLARSVLASGDTGRATSMVEQGMAQASAAYNAATETQPLSASFWRYLDIAALELDALHRCAAELICTGAPPAEMLTNTAIGDTALTLAARIKSLSAQLELSGTVESAALEGTVAPPQFSADADVTRTNAVFLYGVREVAVSFTYENLPADATVLVKVFVDDWEYPPLRHIGMLGGASDGTYTFTLHPGIELGDYSVQVFVNGIWVQQGRFEIVYQEEES